MTIPQIDHIYKETFKMAISDIAKFKMITFKMAILKMAILIIAIFKMAIFNIPNDNTKM